MPLRLRDSLPSGVEQSAQSGEASVLRLSGARDKFGKELDPSHDRLLCVPELVFYEAALLCALRY